MKNSVPIIITFLVAAGLTSAVLYYKNETVKYSKMIDSERYNRLVAEEKAVNSSSKIRQLESDLKSNEDKIAKIQSVLKEQKNINNDLEYQFNRLTKAKTELEDKLKLALSQPQAVAPLINQVAAVETN